MTDIMLLQAAYNALVKAGGDSEIIEVLRVRVDATWLFDEFWDQYPRKIGKAAARIAYKKINPNKDLHEKILQSVEVYKHSEQWTSDRGRYIPYPATYLNQERWEDEIEDAKPAVKDWI